MDKDIKRNKKEYLFLRDEIMKRVNWHQVHTQKATAISISVWSGCFALIAYFLGKDLFNKINLDISILFMMLSILMVLHIFLLFSLSFKIYENYFRISNIFTYLIKFYEKPIYENDENYFSWEIANSKIFEYYDNHKKIKCPVMFCCDETIHLSLASFVLFIIFTFFVFYNFCIEKSTIITLDNIHIWILLSSILFILSILFFVIICKISSYRCIGKIAELSGKFWDNYS